MKRFILASATALGLLASTASAETVGTLSVASGEAGNVVVLRGSETMNVGADFVLQAGDRLVVRGEAAVDVSAYGCQMSLKAPAMAVMGSNFCAGGQPVTLNDGAQQVASTGSSSSGIGLGTAATGAAGTGTLAIAAAAASAGGSGSAAVAAGAPADGGEGGPVSAGSGNDDPASAGADGDALNPGSGLDDGLFEFFGATSS